MKNGKLDVITYEVIRNRVIAITEEMRIALQSVSGSPTVTEASDFYTGLFLADGTFATMGFQVTGEAPPVSQSIQYILREKKVAIRDGDMFVQNDPWIGALHQNDVQMLGPIFWKDEIVAWAGVMAHQTDVGGMDFASWCPKAKEVFQEGLRIPAVRLVEQGEVRQDILDFILGASRLPDQLGLDIRAFIATINVASKRLTEAMGRWGGNTVKRCLHQMLDDGEAHMRLRLRDLPDGEVRVTNYLEHDGHQNRLYRLALLLTKKEDELFFDFSDSSPQAPGFINCTRVGIHSAVAGALFPVFGYDMPWNAGMLRPTKIIAPDGLICTARHPAPVGAATVETCWIVSHLVMAALNKLLACSPRYHHRTQAVSIGGMVTFNLGGINRFGERFGLHLLDPLAGGAGAYATKDGQDAGSAIQGPMPCIADVERNEQFAPIRYLYRRLTTDSGGAGKQRGGRGVEIALSLSDIQSADALIMTHGLEVPNAVGFCGGEPGATHHLRMGRTVLKNGFYPQGSLPKDPALIGGQWEPLGPKPGHVPMGPEDVFATSWQGGGGWGDPLERDAQKVFEDLQREVISHRAALESYGVVVKKNILDLTATEEKRQQIRETRIGRKPDSKAVIPGELQGWPLDEGLNLIKQKKQWSVMCRCGYLLAAGTTAWRDQAVSKPFEPAQTGIPLKLHEDLMMTAFYCPSCARRLSVDLHQRDTVPPHDLLLDLSTVERSSLTLTND